MASDKGGLPTGTVTFLLTDLESSSRLWEEHPEAMKSALARHDTILREAVEAHGGQVVKTTGDGVHAGQELDRRLGASASKTELGDEAVATGGSRGRASWRTMARRTGARWNRAEREGWKPPTV
jgi:class 3 adenylate cyclase